jgi:hypothetical protein
MMKLDILVGIEWLAQGYRRGIVSRQKRYWEVEDVIKIFCRISIDDPASKLHVLAF